MLCYYFINYDSKLVTSTSEEVTSKFVVRTRVSKGSEIIIIMFHLRSFYLEIVRGDFYFLFQYYYYRLCI